MPRFFRRAARRWVQGYGCVCSAVLASCSGFHFVASAPPAISSPAPGPALDEGGRCSGFASTFAQLAACRRADGTLQTFRGEVRIGWRVRYFVRYWEMPCNEAPTREEGYVFHMTTADLYADPDLTDAQRLAIRDAMFSGRVRCR